MTKDITMTSYIVLIALIAFNPSTQAKRNLRPLSEANFEFSLDFYQAISKQEKGNIGLSAHSANSALAMLFMESTSNTTSSQQLRIALHYENMSYLEVHRSHRAMLDILAQPYYEAHKLSNHEAIFVQQGVGIKQGFKRAVEDLYDNRVQEVDFGASGSGRVVKSVNRWVQNVTRGNVNEILREGPGSDTRLLLASTSSFLPQWLYPFDPLKTSYTGLFFLPGEDMERLKVPMMTAQLEVPLGYSPELEARILELPLTDRRMSMFFILPDHINPGLNTLEANLTTSHIKALMGTIKKEFVNVKIPRFRIEETLEVGPALQSLGIEDAFIPGKAKFSQMIENDFVYLTSFKHRTKIETKEMGRHGSSSIKTVAKKIGTLKQKYFEADHPFIFFVWDYFTGTIIFIGRVTRPIVL